MSRDSAGSQKRIALFGGSFCPVHNGHLMLGSWLARFSGKADEVWFVLSAHNPLKADVTYLLSDFERLELLKIATEGDPLLKVCDIELKMPRPSYTINTLDYLSATYRQYQFKWVVGADNWLEFKKWKDYHRIIDDYGVIVYPRPGYEVNTTDLPAGVEWANAPQVDLSSTFIRLGLAEGKNMKAFLPDGVWNRLKDFSKQEPDIKS